MFSLSKAVALFALASTALSAPTAEVEERQLFCPDVKVFFARGTTEIGTLGLIVGPPLETALRRALPGKDVDVEGLDYPALVSGYLAGGDIGGAIRMANDVTSIAGRCPNTKIVMSGYSQGAQVTHRAAARLSSSIQERVNAVVTFGDPYEDTRLPGVLESRRKTFCAFGDLICTGQPIILPAHLGIALLRPHSLLPAFNPDLRSGIELDPRDVLVALVNALHRSLTRDAEEFEF
ncbi:hypothetical protein CVT24_006476 [Panaeolus cyanescens]|uniref:Cutinase n=1 Tax=Panaeolus cyanescens TaxID=181874 RepID=A0A409VZ40_9AGAR|nr:hypothetical protein CVT24_006476 [Panaeolus cyanescens]